MNYQLISIRSNSYYAVHFPTDRDHSAVKGLSASFSTDDHCNINGSLVSDNCSAANNLFDDINSDNHPVICVMPQMIQSRKRKLLKPR